MSEHSQALHIANRWLDFKMNALTQMVPGDPDCDACVLARQFIRTEDSLRVFMTSNAGLTAEVNRQRETILWLGNRLRDAVNVCYGGATHEEIDAAMATNGTTTESAL